MSKIVGLHSRASGGDLSAMDMTTITRCAGKLTGFKFTSQDARSNHGLIKSLGIAPENCIVRLYWDSSGFSFMPLPADFFSWFDLPIKEALADGVRVFEFLNEPNVKAEWKWSATEFIAFAKAVIALFKAAHPDALILSPGLSPDAATFPVWDQAFADGGLYAVCDGIAAHAYGQSAAHLNDPEQLRYYRRLQPRLKGTQKIWITEASLKFYTMTPHEVGLLYGEYAATLEPYVAGVWFFVLQGDAFAASGEEWVSHVEIAHGLADYVPTTPPPVEEREFDHWLDLDTGLAMGTVNPLPAFNITRNMNIQAITRPKAPPPPPPPIVEYMCNVSTDGFGRVVGGGSYMAGDLVRLEWLP